jgi:hypothetical protein
VNDPLEAIIILLCIAPFLLAGFEVLVAGVYEVLERWSLRQTEALINPN